MNFFIGSLLLLVIPIIYADDNKHYWDYSDPDTDWPQHYPMCNGSNQSPINIDTDNVTGMDYSDLKFSIGYRFVQSGPLINDGHALHYSVDESKGASISGGPLTDTYTLNQFHLHWGSEHGQGSEHTVNGQSYDAELHLVHYKSTFDNISAAIASNESDALAVVGILIQEASPWNQYVARKPHQTDDTLRKSARELSRPWRGPMAPSVELEVVPDQFISEITDLTGFYHYTGSLTTPGCAEIVQWIVMDKPFHIHKNLLAALRKNVDMDGKAVQDNYRPTQRLNDRTVYHHEFNVDMSGGGGGFDGPCFVNGSQPCFDVNNCSNALAAFQLPSHSGMNTPSTLTDSGLTADQSGAETCQGYCEITQDCQTFLHACVAPDYGGCACILLNTTEWASLPQQVEWENVVGDGGTFGAWFGPKTGCQTEITSAPSPTAAPTAAVILRSENV